MPVGPRSQVYWQVAPCGSIHSSVTTHLQPQPQSQSQNRSPKISTDNPSLVSTAYTRGPLLMDTERHTVTRKKNTQVSNHPQPDTRGPHIAPNYAHKLESLCPRPGRRSPPVSTFPTTTTSPTANRCSLSLLRVFKS